MRFALSLLAPRLCFPNHSKEWSMVQNVVVLAPNGVTSGPVVVTVNGVSSNAVQFTAQ